MIGYMPPAGQIWLRGRRFDPEDRPGMGPLRGPGFPVQGLEMIASKTYSDRNIQSKCKVRTQRYLSPTLGRYGADTELFQSVFLLKNSHR